MPLNVLCRRSFTALALFGVVASFAPLSDAAPISRSVERFDVKMQNAGIDAGAARTSANATTGHLRSVVTDYGHYSSFITHFESARVVGRSGNQTDVYLEVPILGGASKIWAVVRFSPPEVQGNQEIIRGRLVKGNVKKLEAVWRLKKIDDKTTEVGLELGIVPDLPAPKSLLLKELRKAAGKAVNSARNEAERRNRR